MSLKEKLEIILITFNRKNDLKNTFEELFSDSSPVKDLDITILDNHSTDGTTELVSEFSKRHKNLKHIVHPINIGASSNLLRAYEIAQKTYLWVLCDNDKYDWSSFCEIEEAIDKGYPLILTSSVNYNDKDKWAHLFQIGSFIPASIIKTSEITSTYLINAYYNQENCFPQLGVIAKFINEDRDYYAVEKNIVKWSPNEGSMLRSHDETLSPNRRHWFWLWGYVRSCILITNKDKRNDVLRHCYHFKPTLWGSYRRELDSAMVCGHLSFKHFLDILWILPIDCKIIFAAAYIVSSVRQMYVKKGFFTMNTKEKWYEYFKYINQQKKIDKLARKYRNKKIVLYGAGMFFEALREDCDLSKLNIIAISDKRFEQEQQFEGYRAIPPETISELNPDVLIFSLAETKNVEKALSDLKIKKIHILEKKLSVVIF